MLLGFIFLNIVDVVISRVMDLFLVKHDGRCIW